MRHAIIETGLGQLGIGWTDRGLARLALPSSRLGDQLSRWGRRDVPLASIQPIVERLMRYGSGEPVAFDEFELDLSAVPDFHRAVYAEIRRVKWGQTTTYGDVARRLGDVRLARAVGQAMGANPIPLIIPCHRVLGAGGKTGGFSSPGGVATKMKMLAIEQAATPQGQYSFGF